MSIANNLNALIPTFFDAVQVIQQEKTAYINAVTRNVKMEQMALGMTATYDISPPAQTYDITPGALPAINGETAGSGSLKITRSKAASFEYTGEEQRQLNIAGVYQDKYMSQILQRLRTLRNAIEADLASLYTGASRAVGTAGTAPFQFAYQTTPPAFSGLEAFSAATKEMTDSGCPPMDRAMVVDSVAGQNIRDIPNLTRVNEAGSAELLRNGGLGIIQNFDCAESGQISKITTGAGAAANQKVTGIQAKGTTVFPFAGGTGTFNAGDIIKFGTTDPSRQYIVNASSAGTITIAAPGLMVALPDQEPITLNTTAYTPNMFFSRDAITLVARQPLLPGVGGNANGNGGAGGILLDVLNLPDPGTGLIYQVAMWSMYRQIMIEIAMNWGYAVTNPQDLFVLIGY